MAPAVYLVIGLIAWVGLVALPGLTNPDYSGRPYVLAVIIIAGIAGFIWPDWKSTRVAWLLLTPAVVLVALAPRGDNDGLWLLWWPLLVLMGIPVCALHWTGRSTRQLLRRRHLERTRAVGG